MTPADRSTLVVELTPPGRAAVAVVLIEGLDALQAAGKYFTPVIGQLDEETPIGRIVLGHWGGVAAATEELILCRRSDERIEIHCHGGAAAVEAVIHKLVEEGCQPLTWKDWAQRNSKDGIRVAAQIALADATSERTASILVDQLNGALAAAIHDIIDNVSASNWSGAEAAIRDLLSRRDVGAHLTSPWRVVVFGAPNVGKSSLINALAGYERAIVSPASGTTRDVVSVTTAIDGWPVQLADTAGLRTSEDELESAGIKLATAAMSEADLVIFVHDAASLHEASFADDATKAYRNLARPTRIVHTVNKIDLISSAERPELLDRLANLSSEIRDPKLISALTREGIDSLILAISASLVPVALPAGAAIPFSSHQIDRLLSAKAAVTHCDVSMAATALQALLTKE